MKVTPRHAGQEGNQDQISEVCRPLYAALVTGLILNRNGKASFSSSGDQVMLGMALGRSPLP